MLHRFRLAFDKLPKRGVAGEGKANIKPAPTSVVEGVLYTGVNKDGFASLDQREGVPDHYTRQIVNVTLDDGTTVEAITYVANADKVVDGLRPTKEYLRYLLQGRDVLSESYLQRLEKWETVD